ncbi:MAG TPA: ABC transporter [Clostridiales bacterium UBA9856]|jgi:tungstate transport system ATP-binding protein|nr:ABC transporter [Clostridiales bacterium UBA9856]HOA43256.1 ABC transporter ATP-binding protein [Bacillota bacterium]HPZ59966.1 ABC transporter ATP-binding protein [Bacillota bacterium]
MQVKLEGVKKIYGSRTVLDLEELIVEEGCLFGIIGPNGAGKSTLLNIMAGIDAQTEGKVYYGTDRTEITPYRDITLVFQSPYLLRTTVEKNIAYPLKLRGWQENMLRERVEELMEDLDLTRLRKQKAWTLSSGEMQKVALARALSFRPKLLLLDEPTANIDPATTGEIERMLKKINEQEGTTVVIITHNLSQAKRICGNTAMLHKGRLVETGPAALMLKDPENPLTKAFIDGELLS